MQKEEDDKHCSVKLQVMSCSEIIGSRRNGMEEQEEMKSKAELKEERELKWKDYINKFWVEDDGKMLDVDVVIDGTSALSWESRKRFISSLEYVQKWVNESPDITEGKEFFDYDSGEAVSCMSVRGKGSCRKNRRRENYCTEDYDGPARNTRARKCLFATPESKEPIPVQREKSKSGNSQFDEKSEIDNALFVAEIECDPPDCVAENINNDPVQIGVQNAETEVLCSDSESLSDNAKANTILDTIESMFPVSELIPSDALKADDASVYDESSNSNSPVIDFIKPLTKLNRCTEVKVACTNSEEKNESKSNEVLQDCSNSPRVEHLQKVPSETMLVEGENLLTEMQDSMEKGPAALHTEPQAVRSHESPAHSLHSKCCDSGFHDNSHDEAVCAKSSEKLKVQDGDKKGDSQICNSRMQELVEKTPEQDGDAEQLITTVVKSLPHNNLEEEASPQIQMTSKRDSTPENSTRKVELIRSEFSMEKIARSCVSTASDYMSSGMSSSSLKNESMKKNNFWRENKLIEVQVATNSNLLPSTNTSEYQSDNSLQSHRKFQTLPEAHGDKLAEIKSLEKSHTDISKLRLPEDSSGAEENISNSSSNSNDSSSDISVVDISADDSGRLTKSSSARGKRLTYSRKEESDPFLEQALNALSRKAAKNVEQRCDRSGSMLKDKNDEIIKEISLSEDIFKKSEELCSSDNNDVSVSYSKGLLRITSLISQEMNSSSTRNQMKRDKFQSCSVDSRNRPKNVSCHFKEQKCVSGISQFGDKRKRINQTVNGKTISNDLRSTHLNESIKSSVYSTSKNGVKESLVNTISDEENNNFHITPKTVNAKYSSDVINDVDDRLHVASSKVEDQSRIIGIIQKMNDCSVAALSTPSNKRTERNLCTDLGKKIDTNSEDVLAKDDDSSSIECPTGIQQLKNMNDESSKVDVGVKHSLLETIMSKEEGKTSHIVGDSKSRSSEMENISPCQSEGKTLRFPKLNAHTHCLELTSSFPEDAKKKTSALNRTISQNEITKKGNFDDRFLHPLSQNNTFPGTTFYSESKIIPKANDWSDDFRSKWFGEADLGKKNHAACRNQPEDESSTEIGNLIKAQNVKETINRLHKRLARRKPSQYVSESELRTADNCLEESFPASNTFQSITRISTAKSLREKDVESNNQPGTDHESEEDIGLNSNVEKFKNVNISSEDSPKDRTELPRSVQVEGRSFSCSLEKLAKRSTSNKRDISQPDSDHVNSIGNDMLCKLQPAKGAELGHKKELGSTVKQVSITESFKTVDESSRRDPTVRLKLPTNVLEKECAQDQRSFAAPMIEKPSVVKPDFYQKLDKGSHSHRRKRLKPKIPMLGIDLFSMCDDLDTNQSIGNGSAWRSQTSLDTSRKKRGIFVPSRDVLESELQTAENGLEESFPADNKFQSITRISTAKSLREKDVKSNNQLETDPESEEDRGLNSNAEKVRLAEKFKNVNNSSEDSARVRAKFKSAQVKGRSLSCILGNLAERSTSNKRDVSQHDSGHVSSVENDMLCKIQPAKGSELGHEKELDSTVKQVIISENSKTVDESFRRNPAERLEFPTNVLEKECGQDQRSFVVPMIEKPSVVKPDFYQKLDKGSRSHRRKRHKPKIPMLAIDLFSVCDDLDTNQSIGNGSAWRSQTSLDTSRKKRGIFVPSRDVLESELQTAENVLEESFPADNKFQSITRISTAKSLREKDVKSNNQLETDPESEEDRGLNSNAEKVRLAEKFKNVNNSSEDSARVRAKFKSAQVKERSLSCILGNLAERSTSNKRDVSQHKSGHVNSVENDMLCKIQPAKGSELGHKKELDSTVKQVSISENSRTVDESFRRNPTERLEFSKNVLEKECAQHQRSFAAPMIEKPSVVKLDFHQRLDKGSRSHKRKRRKPKIPMLGIDLFSMCDDLDTSNGNSSAQRSQTSLGSSGKKRERFVIEQNSKTELGTGYGYLGENAQLKRSCGMPVEYVESKKKKVHHGDEPQMREPSDENDRSLGIFFRNGTRNSSFVKFNSHSYNEGDVNHKNVSRFGSETGFLSPEANSSDISSSKWSGKYLDRPLSQDFLRKNITACRKLPARNSIKNLIEVQNLKQFENGSSNKVAGITPSKYVPELDIAPIDDTAQSTAVSPVKSIRERNSALNNHKTEADSNLLKKGVKCNKQLNQVNSSGSRIQVSPAEKFQEVDVSLKKIHAFKAKSSVNVLEKEQERFTSHITEKLNIERHSSSYQKQKENLPSHARSRVSHKIPFLDSDTSDEDPWADQSVPSVSRNCTSTVMLGKGGGGGGEAEEAAAAFVVEYTIKQNRNAEHSSERNKTRKRDIDGKSSVYKKKKPSVSDGSSADHNSDKVNSHLFNGDKHCSEVIIKCGDNDRTVDCSENVPETEQEGSSSAAFQETEHCDLSFTVFHEVLPKRPRKVRLKPYKRVVYL